VARQQLEESAGSKESFASKTQIISDALQAERAKSHSLASANADLTKREKSLSDEKQSLVAENKQLKARLAEAISKAADLEARFATISQNERSLQSQLSSISHRDTEQAESVADLKQKLRTTRQELAEAESTIRALSQQAEELSLVKQQLHGQPVMPSLARIIQQNSDLQKSLEHSQKTCDSLRAASDQTVRQCNALCQPLMQVFGDIRAPPIHFPLGTEEATALDSAVRELRTRIRSQKACTDRIVEHAASIGYRGDDVDGALLAIRKALDASHRPSEREASYQSSDDAKAKSDDRKRASKDYVDKLKAKIALANADIDEWRKVATALVNFHIGAVTDIRLLKAHLTAQESKALGIV
jgi:chromosome segregation ATPase